MHEPHLGLCDGIDAKQNINGRATVALDTGLADGLGSVFVLVNGCTKAQLPPEKLVDVIADFPLQAT